MIKTELVNEMKKHVNGALFINVADLSRFLGKTDRQKVKAKYLSNLEKVGNGYFIPDVAAAIMNEREQS